MIEEGDPGSGGAFLFAVRSASPPTEMPEVDIERYVDRLRFMGIDSELVEEAEHRLQADPREGYLWLIEELRQREPPPRPPTCDCGEALVEQGWQGRATIRCDQCGARWGVEVADGRESQWALSGPTAEWRQSHLDEENYLYGDYQPEDILEQGLPPMPSGIEPGEWFPLAVWKDNRFGAVLYVYRKKAHEFDSPQDEYEPDIDYLRHDPDDGWVSLGGGGGGWVNPFSPPRDLLQKYVVFTAGIAGTRDDETEVNFTGGLCRDDVEFVEVDDTAGVRRYSVDATKIFVVGAYGSHTRVRLLDLDGRLITDAWDHPVEWKLT